MATTWTCTCACRGPSACSSPRISRFSGPLLPDPATPADYERIVRPLYGTRLRRGAGAGAAAEGRARPLRGGLGTLAGDRADRTRARRLKAGAARAAFPLAVAGVNRLLRADFESEVSAEMIFRTGVEGAAELARRLGVDGGHVITGHTHRGGPRDGEAAWRLPGGGQLHNTGNWVFSTPLHHPGRPPNSYWPGTVTWLEDSGPPRRVELLRDREHHDMVELAAKARRLDGLAPTPAASRR